MKDYYGYLVSDVFSKKIVQLEKELNKITEKYEFIKKHKNKNKNKQIKKEKTQKIQEYINNYPNKNEKAFNAGLISYRLGCGDKENQNLLRDQMWKSIKQKSSFFKEMDFLYYEILPEELPPLSGYFKISFELLKPYMSKDDDPLYFLENPIMKEWNFKIPMVLASSWKGNFRWMATKLLAKKLYSNDKRGKNKELLKERISLIKLFGNENPAEEKYLNNLFGKSICKEYEEFLKKQNFDPTISRRGRLQFFPTFFDKIDYDVITPLDRVKRTPKSGPIILEVVPVKSKADLTFLYHPFDIFFEKGLNLKEDEQIEILSDIQRIQKVLLNLLCEYGFSSKRTSGYGLAKKNSLNGSLRWSKKTDSLQLNFIQDYFGIKEVLFNA